MADEGLGAKPVMQVGGMDMGEEDETGGIDEAASTGMCRSRPAVRFAASEPRAGPPTPVARTVWLSMVAADGSGWRPAAWRASARSGSCIRRSVPSVRQRRKCAKTVGQGGTEEGSMRQVHPERAG